MAVLFRRPQNCNLAASSEGSPQDRPYPLLGGLEGNEGSLHWGLDVCALCVCVFRCVRVCLMCVRVSAHVLPFRSVVRLQNTESKFCQFWTVL